MKGNDPRLAEWLREYYPPSNANYACHYDYGSPDDGPSTLWCASLLDRLPLVEHFTILDWGCGDGRLFNFLSRRFKYFQYWGLERPGPWGDLSIARARWWFHRDPRATFDVYDTATEIEAITSSSWVVMGSIATHLPINHFEALLFRLRPLFERGRILVASMFIDAEYACSHGSVYGHPDCYGRVGYTFSQVDEICERQHLRAAEAGQFEQGTNLHRIMHFGRA